MYNNNNNNDAGTYSQSHRHPSTYTSIWETPKVTIYLHACQPGHANIVKMLRPVYGALWRKEPEVADDPDAKTSWELTEKWLTTAAYWVNKGEYDVDKDKLQFSMAAAVNELLSLGLTNLVPLSPLQQKKNKQSRKALLPPTYSHDQESTLC